MRVVWSLQAISDLENIETYFSDKSPRAGARIRRRIVERIENQAGMPLAAPRYKGGPGRILVVAGTSYLVIYTVADNELRVRAVMHAAQNR